MGGRLFLLFLQRIISHGHPSVPAEILAGDGSTMENNSQALAVLLLFPPFLGNE
ncbi:MAG: hypothetical protein WCA23_14565 [Stellaceae bacterium]